LFPQPERNGGGNGSAPPSPAQPELRAPAELAAQEEGARMRNLARGRVLRRRPRSGGPIQARDRERGPHPPPAPWRCGSGLPADLERLLARARAPAVRTLQRYSGLWHDSTHTHTHSPRPTRSLRGQPETRRAARTHSLWVPHTRTRPAPRPIPRPAGRAAPPTFPDSGDAGSAPRVALGGGGGCPEQ
jgi:hypothetical protein